MSFESTTPVKAWVSIEFLKFALNDEIIYNRIARFIEYVRNHNGKILTASNSKAKELYDKKTTKLDNRSY